MCSDSDNLFPLRCTAFERYMLLDDTPEHPMSSFLEVDVTGQLDEDILSRALELVLPRHPLLTAVIRRSFLGRPYWTPGRAAPRMQIDRLSIPVDDQNAGPMDLTTAAGIRIWLRRDNDRAVIVLQVHHACCDALSMIALVIEWLAQYGQLKGIGDVPRLPESTHHELRQRGRIPTTRRSMTDRRRTRGILRAIRVLGGAKAQPIYYPPRAVLSETPSLAGYWTKRIDASDFAELCSQLPGRTTVNDWLITSLFRTIAAWNREHSTPHDEQLLRLMIPVSYQSTGAGLPSASNRISYKTLTRSVIAETDYQELLSGIRDEMNEIRAAGTTRFLTWLKWADRIPGLLPYIVRSKTCGMTAVLSNLGNIAQRFRGRLPVRDGRFQVGNLVVDGFRCAPPASRSAGYTVLAYGYADELVLVSRSHGGGLCPENSRQLLNQFCQRIRDISVLEKSTDTEVSKPDCSIAYD